MPAFLIANIMQVHDRELLGEYADLVAPMIESYGGKRIGTSAPAEVLEGSWEGRRTVIFEFPDMAVLDKFYYSDEYKPLIEMRQKSADVTIVKIEGVE
ncbi:MAG: DUF1330 domain-containing protein [Rhodospirillaceae bacterium]|jgi:uncharacterized protein (DUF1330 family)|nr:DUF1330 domain-containing protein [Rhodospirillaceae bacterium]MBT7955326.1 DUF1330 domain-containing protein [Rhodospirillaceae bacterium]